MQSTKDGTRLLERHDVSDLIGLRVVVINAAQEIIDQHGDAYVEVPDIEQLAAAAAVARCLLPIRLRGSELRAIRRIAAWKADELAKRLDTNTSPQTVSRWENEKQPMGGYVEKVFRLNVCEELKDHAPGVEYDAGAIARLRVFDPWLSEANYEVPLLIFDRVKVKMNSKLVEAWVDDLPKAA